MSERSCRNVTQVTAANDLCSGCGICAGVCPSHNLQMGWNADGGYVPSDTGKCREGCSLCLQSCPFACLEGVNEDTLAAARFGATDNVSHLDPIGYYRNCYVGSVAEGSYRLAGSSGGMAKWFLAQLLERDLVDRVICVRPSDDPEKRFAFTIAETAEEVRAGSKSAYYPVELSEVLERVLSEPGRYAVIGLPCFLKGLALAERVRPAVAERILWRIGLGCGQLKSSYYARRVIRALGVEEQLAAEVSLREKNEGQRGSNYRLAVRLRSGESVSGQLSEIGRDAWIRGDLKLRACNFCDDVFAEVADVTFMDAWLPAYHNDWRGNNLAIARSEGAEAILGEGIASGALAATTVGTEEILASNRSTLGNKRGELSYRLWLAARDGQRAPAKRVDPKRPCVYDQLRLRALERFRKASLAAMRAQIASGEPGLARYRAGIRWSVALLTPFLTWAKIKRRLAARNKTH